MLEFFKKPNFDFLGKRRYAYAFSAVLIAASVASLAVKGLNYGVDFRGGTEIRIKFRSSPDVAGLRAALAAAGIGEATLQRYGVPEDHEVLVRVGGATSEESVDAVRDVSRQVLQALETAELRARRAGGAIDLNQASRAELMEWLGAQPPPAGHDADSLRALAAALVAFRDEHGGLVAAFEALSAVPGMTPDALALLRERATLGDFALRSVDYVGPSVGAELRKKALLAVIGSLIGILIYLGVRFEAKFGLSAVVTVAHDALVTVGMFSLTQRPFDLSVVAAVLTIVGYSLNDTIVIFDRVRENLHVRRSPGPLAALMNASLNETLSRSILTSLTVLLVVISLFLFGGDRINDFAFAMLIGVVVGSYSTIYISCPFVLLWEAYRERRRLRAAA